jgi:hypothetical protein
MKDDNKALDRILAIFSSIDERIAQLHQCSSDDFLSLNKALKENYQKASFITEKASLAFDRMGEQGNLKTLFLLKENLELFQKDVADFEYHTDSTLTSLERIQSNFSLMFVPINNFRQNLISLRLLLTNIKLTNTYFDKSVQSFSESEVIHIDKIINKVKDSCPVFEENIFNMQKYVRNLYDDLTLLKEKILADILKNLEVMQVDFDIIEKHNNSALKNQDRLDEISCNCKKSVGSIITNLQYHDIIRQKMEHIQQTHKLIRDEISLKKAGDSQAYVLQIPKISEIQVGQLIHTNKEYQKAIEHISSKLVEIGKDMTETVRLCRAINILEYKEKMLETGVFNSAFRNSVKSGYLERYTRLSDEINLLNKTITQLYHKYQDIDMMESAIEQRIIDKISFSNLLISPENETATQAQQILKLYADNHFEKNKMKSLFENTRIELKETILRNVDFISDRNGVEKLHVATDDAINHFETIRTNILYLDKIQEQITLKSQEINEENTRAIAGVKYYDLFEKAIDELVEKFEQITAIIKSQNITSSVTDTGSLQQIERYYTMKSERIIHNHTISGFFSQNSNEHMVHAENNEGNDVEFF